MRAINKIVEGEELMRDSVDKETLKQIKLRAHELCKEISARNPHEIMKRNRIIIEQLMKEFDISERLAEECFLHNNEN